MLYYFGFANYNVVNLLFTIHILFGSKLVQDEALLSDWKQQLDCDIETMKAQSNVVSIRLVSLATSL